MRVLQHTVPVAVPGITFLSGGLSEEDVSQSDPPHMPPALTHTEGVHMC